MPPDGMEIKLQMNNICCSPCFFNDSKDIYYILKLQPIFLQTLHDDKNVSQEPQTNFSMTKNCRILFRKRNSK